MPLEDDEKQEKEGQQEKTNVKQQIFREVSLERLSNPEQLDALLVVVSSQMKTMIYCLIAIIVCVILWAVFGQIPIKIQGRGIVLNEKGLFYNIQTSVDGTVGALNVRPGDFIEQGQLIAEIIDPQEEIKRKDVEIKLTKLTNDLEKLKSDIEKERAAQEKALHHQMAAQEFRIKELELQLQNIKTDLAKKEKLFKQGLISAIILHTEEDNLHAKNIEYESSKAELTNIHFNLTKKYREDELKAKENELLEVQQEKDLLKVRQPYFNMYSPSSGEVLELLVGIGDHVTPGSLLIWMEHRERKAGAYICYGYFPVEKGKRIVVGTQVEMELSTVDSQEYGYLLGTIKEISSYPVSKNSLLQTIHNTELVDYLIGEDNPGQMAVIQGVIEPLRDANGKPVWTSGKTPLISVTTGTVCTIHAIVERVRPIYYLLPVGIFKTTVQEECKMGLEK